MMNDKAQMMVLESVLFVITILVSLIFLYQLSPTSTVSNDYTNDLKIKGDEALQTLYNDEVPADLPQNGIIPQDFPKNKLIYYLITDDCSGLISLNLQYMLPSSTMYNIYISNGTKTVFWCNSSLGSSTPITLIEPITISHYMIAIHPQFFNLSKFPDIIDGNGCELAKKFDAYKDPGAGDYSIKEEYKVSTYDVILKMCYV